MRSRKVAIRENTKEKGVGGIGYFPLIEKVYDYAFISCTSKNIFPFLIKIKIKTLEVYK